ncbi:hypothetical protein AKJ09_01750 [Labilithrix luteola]|uniref:Uncharacterized protein n=1 Tax=Labilithrix luteola TaxID=1391654 RepID=A0A0K1PNU9_9BACT|nr:hypothetical protein AKJ09_01750 [Labilithrix luteola]
MVRPTSLFVASALFECSATTSYRESVLTTTSPYAEFTAHESLAHGEWD